MKITPIGERVLIEPAKQEEKTKGGIYIPDTAKEDRKEGIVKAVGTLKDGKEMPLKEGDHILYGGYSNEDIEIDGERFVIVDYKDVIAKIEKA